MTKDERTQQSDTVCRRWREGKEQKSGTARPFYLQQAAAVSYFPLLRSPRLGGGECFKRAPYPVHEYGDAMETALRASTRVRKSSRPLMIGWPQLATCLYTVYSARLFSRLSASSQAVRQVSIATISETCCCRRSPLRARTAGEGPSSSPSGEAI